jgi:hypothetical protein
MFKKFLHLTFQILEQKNSKSEAQIPKEHGRAVWRNYTGYRTCS